MTHENPSLDDVMLFSDFQKKRPDLVGPDPKGSYHLIQRREKNGLEEAGALIKRRGHWFVHVPRFTQWFLAG